MKEIIEKLNNIGLNKKQATVYTTLLKIGESTAYNISKESKIKPKVNPKNPAPTMAIFTICSL